ncbi:MAG: glutamate-5-semialdehyde dehydrogenase [Alphaproteobacteria bacterium]
MEQVTAQLKKVKAASRALAVMEEAQRVAVLRSLADELEASVSDILRENEKDLAAMPKDDPRYDRLLLNKDRVTALADDVRKVADLPSPLNKVLEETARPNGLKLKKISVPLGVAGVIYESRPNVTVDVFALCFKAGNACALKGGKEAQHSNRVLADAIHRALKKNNVDTDTVYLLPPDREATQVLLDAVGLIDVCIPRGSQGLIDHVRNTARVPVIETGAGIVHTYFDASGDLEKGKAIVNNAKTRRVSVCNALDTLVIHDSRLKDLAALAAPLANSNVEIFADEAAYAQLAGYPQKLLHKATPEDFGREFLSYKMSVKTVASKEAAVAHIMHYTSHHSEAIIAEDAQAVDYFMKNVDAAAVYANASTAFTDGGQFGMGAEIGISTQKLHARGPMGLEALTSYKWLVYGDGQIRK